MAADGSFVVKVKADTSPADKELAKLKTKISTMEAAIQKTGEQRFSLAEQAKQASVAFDEAYYKLRDMKAAAKGTFSKEDIADQQTRVRMLGSDYNRIAGSLERTEEKLRQSNANLASMQSQAGELQQNIDAAERNARQFAPDLSGAEKAMQKFTNRVIGLARRVFVFTLITKALRSMRDWLGKAVKTNAEATNAIARLKGALLTLAQPLVGIIIPAFTALVNVLANVVSAVATVVSFLFGTTVDESAKAAEGLYNEQNALEGVGASAKKAGKSLAAFDEINKLASETTESSGTSVIAPDFSTLKEMQDIAGELAINMTDILIKWDDLTEEDILAKIVVGLGALAGGVIGFMVGGFGGAAIGIVVGASLGLMVDNLLLDGDGKLNEEEIFSMVSTAIFTLTGGVLGAAVGGPWGAGIGLTIGAALSVLINKLLLDGDGQMSAEEILSMVAPIIGALSGGILGGMVGGLFGAGLGIIVGASLGLLVSKFIFDGDGELSEEEIASSIVTALGFIAGGVIGFFAGGPGGAFIGATIGTGISLAIKDLIFDGDGEISTSEILDSLALALGAACGGIIGFYVGGPAGAVVGVVVGLGVTGLLKSLVFDSGELTFSKVFSGLAKILESSAVGFQGMKVGNQFGAQLATTLGLDVKAEIIDLDLDAFDRMGKQIEETLDGIVHYMETDFAQGWGSAWNDAKETFKTAWNGTIQFLEDALNIMISGVNILISGLNMISFTAPDWVPGIGGKSFGVSIPKIPSASIPRLAQGAVIPANREFLAVLGDQKRGNNIETPESLLRQIVREESGQDSRILQAILEAIKAGQVMVVDGQQFGKVVRSSYNRENSRVGVSFATGGAR